MRVLLQVLFVFMMACCLASGCRTLGREAPAERPDSVHVWPPEPEQPRVKYVTSFKSSKDLDFQLGWFRSLLNFITGSLTGREILVKPLSLSIDEKGNLCVADTGSMSVHYYDFENRKARSWKRVGKIRLQSPVSTAKRDGVYYVADSVLGSVMAFNEKGKLLMEIKGKLVQPVSLLVDDDSIYVADCKLHKILIYNLNGEYVSEFGERGSGAGEFNYPTHMAIDAEGRLLVTDSMNHRIQIMTLKGDYLSEIGRVGDGSGCFSRPKGLSGIAGQQVYITDALFDNVQIFDYEGRFLLNFGVVGNEIGEFWMPSDVQCTSGNLIYVADTYNKRIQVFKYIGD